MRQASLDHQYSHHHDKLRSLALGMSVVRPWRTLSTALLSSKGHGAVSLRPTLHLQSAQLLRIEMLGTRITP